MTFIVCVMMVIVCVMTVIVCVMIQCSISLSLLYPPVYLLYGVYIEFIPYPHAVYIEFTSYLLYGIT